MDSGAPTITRRTGTFELLGDIDGQGGLRSRALAAYRRALDVQPHNRQAQRELARLEGTEVPSPGAGRLLGFLKKR